MNMSAKSVLAHLLRPLASLYGLTATPWTRVWALALLRSRLAWPVDGSVVLEGAAEIHGTGQIRLGHDLYLYPSLYLETRDEGEIRIGDRVVMSRGVHLSAREGIVIGDDTMIGEYTSVRDADHDRDACGLLRNRYRSAPIIIGQRVWIGRGVIVLPGVRIGDGAIVAANAVVSRDVPAGAVVAGVPARVVHRSAVT